jgi:hypothetical protein
MTEPTNAQGPVFLLGCPASKARQRSIPDDFLPFFGTASLGHRPALAKLADRFRDSRIRASTVKATRQNH